MTPPPGRLIPLLALAQCAALIDHVAATGTVDAPALSHLLRCLLEPSRGGSAPLGRVEDYPIGREVLEDLLSGELPENQAGVPRYMRALAAAQRRLASRPELDSRLHEALGHSARHRDLLGGHAGTLYAGLAGIYVETLGQLDPPLCVSGAWRQITDRNNGNLIRAIALAGVQAAAQWRAEGGRPWHLRLGRRTLLHAVKSLERR